MSIVDSVRDDEIDALAAAPGPRSIPGNPRSLLTPRGLGFAPV